ncbi:uncharacterized protein LY89DRAFT_663090 [Mollisia scopiformis]|uniref:Uncharacterized protein n=1 Tax=Mollisia scopiformis TaxID=149040 RepID=A0A194XX32_MOLSC|nr:uncharacterized protein LY89DRAFT_663090 [Mollisia scopiformis]KUJ24342.1 hypothetical protein LY89DRAFT_663090 [Mollisia scopiformis]
MYKWHVHSAIGRGRPAANDFSKVVDGIAASLRQFSVSVSRSAEDGDGPRISRSQRSADAFKEVSTLAPKPPRGIDARSLAAKSSFTITRYDAGPGRGGGFVPRGGNSEGVARGGAGMRGRGRGGARGRGARGRGRGARRGGEKKKRGPRERADDDDFISEPYSEEELAYLEMSEGGFPTNYVPETTSAASLARYGPAVMSSPRGIHESIVNRMMVATENNDPSFEHASIHLARMNEGLGTLFEDAEQRALTEKFQGSRKFMSLSEQQKDSIMRQWAAGQYTAPGTPVKGNVVGLTRQMTRRNETYLPEDAQKFDKTLKSLLPKHMQEAVYEKVPASL